eukprot:PhF_6_TR25610/c0_g1_i3/m.35945
MNMMKQRRSTTQYSFAKAAVLGYIRECALLAKHRSAQRNVPFDPKPWNDLASTAIADLTRYDWCAISHEESMNRVMNSLNVMCLSSPVMDGGVKTRLCLAPERYGAKHPDLDGIHQRRHEVIFGQISQPPNLHVQ